MSMLDRIRRAGLGDVHDKVAARERLTFDEGVRLFTHPDLFAVGWIANLDRERRHGGRTFFNYNLRIEATNVCEASCLFCSFARLKEGDPGARTATLEQMFEQLRRRADQPLTEVHCVNGLHPGLPFSYYTDLLAGLKAIRPGIHLKCFTAVEIAFFADLYGKTDRQVLEELRAAGLDSLTGGGAEIFAPRARKKISADKCDAARYLSVHRTAHQMGMASTCTMLYGHIETIEERVDHLLQLRGLQDETRGFQAFIPLAFHPDNNAMRKLPAPSATDTLRVLAVSRLLLDNIEHIKAYWVSCGVDVAQAALWFGADDLDGTVQAETIYHMAGSRTPGTLSTAEIENLIRAAGREPLERDTLYNIVRVPERVPVGRYAAGAR